MSNAITMGIFWHLIGAASAACFYAPFKKVKKWSWETMWSVGGIVSWIILPWAISALLLPNFWAYYSSFSLSTLLPVFLFGAMWGANMLRKTFVMQVNPDAHAEYQRRHNPIWPELEAVLKSHGAHNYAIYLDKARNLLFATVEIESEERWNAVASTEVCQRWWKHMQDVMPANPDNSPVSSELQDVFYMA